MDINWVREYNKLFEAINEAGTPEYFSGARFIGIVREFDNDFLDYSQYISYRNSINKSTSRKSYYYDILMDFDIETRRKIIDRIWEEINNSKKAAADKPIKKQYNFESLSVDSFEISTPTVEAVSIETAKEINESPTVFISYSWDSEEHKKWIQELANKLIENGVTVLLDVYELGPGKNMLHFMDSAIKKSDKVIMIFTPNYKLKSEHRQGGVGYEYSILNVDLYKSIISNEKYIPVLRAGTIETSIPDFIQQFIAVQMTNDSLFEERIKELLKAIYGKPQIQKPALGKKPDFLT